MCVRSGIASRPEDSTRENQRGGARLLRDAACEYHRKEPRPMPAVQVPERFNAAAFFLDRHLHEGRGSRTTFRYAGRRVTYQDVGERANRLGNALRSRGVDMGAARSPRVARLPEFAGSVLGRHEDRRGAGSGGRRAPFRGLRVPDQRQPGARGRCERRGGRGDRLRAGGLAEALGDRRRRQGPSRRALLRAIARARRRPISQRGGHEPRRHGACGATRAGSTGQRKAAVHLHHDFGALRRPGGPGRASASVPDDLVPLRLEAPTSPSGSATRSTSRERGGRVDPWSPSGRSPSGCSS